MVLRMQEQEKAGSKPRTLKTQGCGTPIVPAGLRARHLRAII